MWVCLRRIRTKHRCLFRMRRRLKCQSKGRNCIISYLSLQATLDLNHLLYVRFWQVVLGRGSGTSRGPVCVTKVTKLETGGHDLLLLSIPKRCGGNIFWNAEKIVRIPLSTTWCDRNILSPNGLHFIDHLHFLLYTSESIYVNGTSGEEKRTRLGSCR